MIWCSAGSHTSWEANWCGWYYIKDTSVSFEPTTGQLIYRCGHITLQEEEKTNRNRFPGFQFHRHLLNSQRDFCLETLFISVPDPGHASVQSTAWDISAHLQRAIVLNYKCGYLPILPFIITGSSAWCGGCRSLSVQLRSAEDAEKNPVNTPADCLVAGKPQVAKKMLANRCVPAVMCANSTERSLFRQARAHISDNIGRIFIMKRCRRVQKASGGWCEVWVPTNRGLLRPSPLKRFCTVTDHKLQMQIHFKTFADQIMYRLRFESNLQKPTNRTSSVPLWTSFLDLTKMWTTLVLREYGLLWIVGQHQLLSFT